MIPARITVVPRFCALVVGSGRMRPTTGAQNRGSGQREDARAVGGDRHGVLDMGTAAAVGGDDRPAVGADPVVVAATGHQTRLDRDDESGPKGQAPAGSRFVVYEGILVHRPSDAVSGEVVLDAVAGPTPDD